MRHTIRFFTTAVAALTLCWAGAAQAQVLSESVPADATAYVGWQGSETIKPAYAQSHLKTFIDASGIAEYVEKSLPAMLEKEVADKDREAFKTALSMGGIMWKYPGALYVGPIDGKNAAAMQPGVAFVCKAGKDSAALAKQIKDLQAKAAESGSEDAEELAKIRLLSNADRVVVMMGNVSEDARALLLGEALASQPRLSTTPAFTAAVGQVQKDAIAVAYVDGAALRKAALDFAATSKDAETKKRTPILLDVLGLNGVTQVAYSAGFSSKNWEDRLFVGTSGPRKGLLKIFDGKPLDPASLKLVPKAATSVSLVRMDASAVFAQFRASLAKVDAKASEDFERNLARADEQVKMSIEKDILAALGDEWLFYRTMREGDAVMPQGFGFMNKVANAKKAAETMAALEAMALEAGAPLQKQKIADVDAAVIVTGPLGFGWAMVDGYLVIGLADELEAAITQIKTKKDGLAELPEVATVLKQLGDGVKSASVIEYGDPKKPYATVAKMGQQLIQMYAGRGSVEIPDNLIPDAEKVGSALVPGGGVVYADAAGIHVRSINGLPAIGLLNGQITSSGPGIAVGAAILLPSLGRARELSNRSYEAANLRGIAMSCNIWAADNQDAMPEHLAQLVAARQISMKQLVSKRSNTTVGELTEEQLDAAAKDWTTIKKIVDEHSDVIYVGKGMKADTDSTQILVYSDPAKVGITDGLNIGFSDGHCEWVRVKEIEEAFELANKGRAEAKQPLLKAPEISKRKPVTTPGK